LRMWEGGSGWRSPHAQWGSRHVGSEVASLSLAIALDPHFKILKVSSKIYIVSAES
jgi:hypothetical protein